MTIRFIALSGFLGSGKTTTMLAAAHALEAAGGRVAVITNDQADDLVDTAVATQHTDTVGQVSGGCFCCRFDDLMDTVTGLVQRDRADTVIAESVGSCTDLQATVIRPLMSLYAQDFAVSPLTTLVDPSRAVAFARAWRAGAETDLVYLFRQQLLDAQVIVLNKTDYYPRELLDKARAAIEEMAPGRRVIEISAVTGAGLADLLQVWRSAAVVGDDLDVDYDRYAAAEADLAWCNTTVALQSDTGLDLQAWTQELLNRISTACSAADYTIGHVKVLIRFGQDLVKGAVTASGDRASIDICECTGLAGEATATINARVAAPPAALDTLIQTLVEEVSRGLRATVTLSPVESFKPGYPNPVHRLPAAALA